MALLKLQASSLVETLVSLFLIVIVFSVSAVLIHSFYLKGIDSSDLNQRNQANGIAYFHHFNELEKFNQRFTDSIILQYSVEKTSAGVSVFFLNDLKITSYVFILE